MRIAHNEDCHLGSLAARRRDENDAIVNALSACSAVKTSTDKIAPYLFRGNITVAPTHQLTRKILTKSSTKSPRVGVRLQS